MFETYRQLGREHEADLEREAKRRRLAKEASARRSTWPLFVGAVAVLVLTAVALAAMSAAASASNAPVLIPFTKTKVGPDHYVGTACDGASLDVRMSNVSWTGNVQHFTATFVIAGLPNGRGFTAVLDGIYNDSTGRTLLTGTVTEGWLAGAQVQEEGQFAGLADGAWPIFTGELRLMPASS